MKRSVLDVKPGDRLVCPIDGDVDEVTAVAALQAWVSISTPRHVHRFMRHAELTVADGAS